MSEVAIRRTFLDRRACLETNSKLEYERKQEVSFLELLDKLYELTQKNLRQHLRIIELNLKKL
jgi:hypothetical protein